MATYRGQEPPNSNSVIACGEDRRLRHGELAAERFSVLLHSPRPPSVAGRRVVPPIKDDDPFIGRYYPHSPDRPQPKVIGLVKKQLTEENLSAASSRSSPS